MKFHQWAEQRQEVRRVEVAEQRAKEKFRRFLQGQLVGKSLEEVEANDILRHERTFKLMLKAELGELDGTGRRPVTTPRRG